MLIQRYLTTVYSSNSHPLAKTNTFRITLSGFSGFSKKSERYTIVSALDIYPNIQIYNYTLDALLHTAVVDAEVRSELI
jgi:hypothetical protein